MKLSIIIVSYNTKELTINCLKSIFKHTNDFDYEVIVVDNASGDGSVKAIKKSFKDKVKLIENNKNLGFGAANNLGLEIARGEFILLLNSDTKVNGNILKEMTKWMKDNKDIGILGCKLRGKNGDIQANGGYFPTLIRVFSWMTIQDIPLVDKIIKPFHPMKDKAPTKEELFFQEKKELDWVTGAFMLMSNKVVQDVGRFDTEYYMYTEEVDYCYRAKKQGWKVFYNPKWDIIHLGGASSTREFPIINEIKGIKRFYKKHYPTWQYPILRILLKVGMLGRAFLFGLMEGRDSQKIYVKAFKIA